MHVCIRYCDFSFIVCVVLLTFAILDNVISQQLSLVDVSFRNKTQNKQKIIKKPATDDVITINVNETEARQLMTNKYQKRSQAHFYSTYHSLETIHERMVALIKNSKSKEVSLQSLGKSYEGRDQLVVQFDSGIKPLVLMYCNIHGNEWSTAMFCSFFLEKLLEQSSYSWLTQLFDIAILPVANPDGYVFSQNENPFWRKTRKPSKDKDCVGVDPNRNFDFMHNKSNFLRKVCSEFYGGPHPWSEQIVKNIRDYGLKNENRLVAFVDVHARGKLVMFPYGAIEETGQTEHYKKQSTCAANFVGAIHETSRKKVWKYGPIWSTVYPASGSAVDWFYEHLNVIHSYAVEIGAFPLQNSAQNIRQSNQEALTGLVALLKCVAEQKLLEV